MPIFIKTDSDEAMLEAMRIAQDDTVTAVRATPVAQEVENPIIGCIASLDDLGSESLGDFVASQPNMEPIAVNHFDMSQRTRLFNSVNSFNAGIDMGERATIKNMEDISRQGLSSSMFLFAALGHPVDD